MSGLDLLREYQRTTGTNQTQLAARFNVTAAYVSFLLSGDRIPGLSVAHRIERATGGSVPALSWLVDLSNRAPRRKRSRVVRRAASRRAGQPSNRSR